MIFALASTENTSLTDAKKIILFSPSLNPRLNFCNFSNLVNNRKSFSSLLCTESVLSLLGNKFAVFLDFYTILQFRFE